jgi:hypothetical protein
MTVPRAPQELRQFESVRELQHPIAGGVNVIDREEPIDGILQLRFAQGVGDPRHLSNPDGTADADDAGIHDPVLGSTMMKRRPSRDRGTRGREFHA